MTGRAGSRDWAVCQGDKGASHYSPLDQINRSNVHRLQLAWTYHTGDKREKPPSTIECNPIVVDGIMYVTSPMIKVIALDAASGKLVWHFQTTHHNLWDYDLPASPTLVSVRHAGRDPAAGADPAVSPALRSIMIGPWRHPRRLRPGSGECGMGG